MLFRAVNVCTVSLLLTFSQLNGKVCICDACLKLVSPRTNIHVVMVLALVTHVLYVLQCLAGMASLGLFVRTKIIAAHTKILYLFPFGRVMI